MTNKIVIKELIEDIRSRIKKDGECRLIIKNEKQKGMSHLAINVLYPFEEKQK